MNEVMLLFSRVQGDALYILRGGGLGVKRVGGRGVGIKGYGVVS
jgi:hypothetical protein